MPYLERVELTCQSTLQAARALLGDDPLACDAIEVLRRRVNGVRGSLVTFGEGEARALNEGASGRHVVSVTCGTNDVLPVSLQSLFVVRHVSLPEGVGAEAGDASKVCVPVRGRSLSKARARRQQVGSERTHFASPAKRTYTQRHARRDGRGMGSTDTNLEHNKVKLGPLTIEGSLGPALAAERFEAFSPGGQAAIAWRWPSESLDRLSIPSFAQLIDAMQDVEVAGVAKLLHGSVATEHAVIAFTRPRGSSIKDYLLRGKTSPLETLNSALTLIDALAALRRLGLRGAWWTPSSLWVSEDEAQWTLGAPCLMSILRSQDALSLEEVVFRAPEAARVPELSQLEDQDFAALTSYALGATLYYSLLGEFPFAAKEPHDYLAAQHASRAPRIETRSDYLEAHRKLSNTIESCLEFDPSLRPQSLELLRRLLEESEEEARFQHSRVDYLPARVSETQQMPRPQRADANEKPMDEPRSRFLPLLALVTLVAIALFLIGR